MTWKHDFFSMTSWIFPLCTPIIWKPLPCSFQNRSCFHSSYNQKKSPLWKIFFIKSALLGGLVHAKPLCYVNLRRDDCLSRIIFWGHGVWRRSRQGESLSRLILWNMVKYSGTNRDTGHLIPNMWLLARDTWFFGFFVSELLSAHIMKDSFVASYAFFGDWIYFGSNLSCVQKKY